MDGFRRPHTLLNAYILHFSGFRVTDGQHFVDEEHECPLPVFSQYRLDFSKLKKRNDMLVTIHQLSTHYLMRSTFPVTLGKDEEAYVEYGFARFVDSETKTVAVDEPLVLLAATYWINRNYGTSYKHFAKQIQDHNPLSNGFENYIAFCLDMALAKKPVIKDLFTFPGTPPTWAYMQAELVALHRIADDTIEISPVSHFGFSGPSLTLGVNAKSAEETSAWLNAHGHAAICFPHTSLGPDMLLVLKLDDGSMIWVAVQTKYTQGKNGAMSRPMLRQALKSVTPAFYFIDKVFSPTASIYS